MSAHWDKQARQWEYIGSPLRPSPTDIQTAHSWVTEKIHGYKNPLSVLLLGATPEIVHIPWPANTTFLAIDNNLGMLKSILPIQTISIKPLALAGNWLQLPLSSSSVDIVMGDGCYSSLAENDYVKMTGEVRRVLKPDGIFIMRFFTRPQTSEPVDFILNDLLSGKIDNFHVLKLRLAMALHGTMQQGVCLKNIWNCWNTLFKKNIQLFMKQFLWSDKVVRTIDNYKNSNVFYTFPTVQEIRVALGFYFREEEIFFPNYTLGERCPTLKLKPF